MQLYASHAPFYGAITPEAEGRQAQLTQAGARTILGGKVEGQEPGLSDDLGRDIRGQQRPAGWIIWNILGWDAWQFSWTYDPALFGGTVRGISSAIYLGAFTADHEAAWAVHFADWVDRGCPEDDLVDVDPLVLANVEAGQ